MSKSPFKKLTLNLPFHDFEKEPKFIGVFNGIVTLGEKEPFKVAIFTDVSTGEQKFVTMSYQIEHSIENANAEENTHVFEMVFNGKTEIKGKPLNQFDVSACTVQEYDTYIAETKKSKK